MILEQITDRLTFRDDEERRIRVLWFLLVLAAITNPIAYWILKSKLEIFYLILIMEILMVVIGLTEILRPRIFDFDLAVGNLTILHYLRIYKWRVEWKKVYPLKDIQAVRLFTHYGEGGDEHSGTVSWERYWLGLVIRRKNQVTGRDRYIRVKILEDRYHSYETRAQAKTLAAYLGVEIVEKRKRTFL